MPGLARKLLIFAAVDGLIVQQRGGPATKIAYEDNCITQVSKDGSQAESSGTTFEAFGLVGLLTVSKSSFLITIVKRQQVAQIKGSPVYVITDVALTPLSSKTEAELSIANTRSLLQKTDGDHGMDESDTDDEEAGLSVRISDEVGDDSIPTGSAAISQPHRRTTSVAEDVMARKGGYGRFAQKWFSKKGWTADQRRNLGMTSAESDIANSGELGSKDIRAKVLPAANDSPRNESIDVVESLLPKLLRTTQILFGSSQSFFFSYDYDLTRSFANRTRSKNDDPLHTRVDPTFWWNHNIIQPFIESGQNSLILPLIQGFVGQRSFEMDPHPPKAIVGLDGAAKSSVELVDLSASQSMEQMSDNGIPGGPQSSDRSTSHKSFLLTLISRRSVKRAGLRYLRRGVDEEGFTANGVETEQILSDPSWGSGSKLYSFLQVRGSIPVFFSQSPYSFKPVPQLSHSDETNYKSFSRHFKYLSDTYGSVQAVSLVEKHGAEAIVGDRYEMFLKRFNEETPKKVGFEWFDFHAICRGMKFENVSLLMDKLGEKLDLFGQTVEFDGEQVSKQEGVLRTNCMDCLDRTNVVQSACGMRALESQLKEEGIDMSLQPDQTTQWFNTVWADNGDAVSKQYASTAALKGDFTRTRKRDFQGAIKDMGLSISRFYSGIVNDYFSQAAIDFLLGNVTSVVFEDFEANLMSSDPGVSMQKMRQHAIEQASRLVVADEHEELIGGWTLLTPQLPNTVKSLPFEESILLLTDAGLYSVRFDWDMEKVSSFERIDLQHISQITYGTYITSTLSAAQVDEQHNVGFVIKYKAGADHITRVNTRSMSNIQSRAETDLLAGTSVAGPQSIFKSFTGPAAPALELSVLALKAVPVRSAVAGNEPRPSEIEQVKGICSAIERMILHGQVVEVGTERKSIMESGEIISLSEARKSTGLLEQLTHSIKKLVWA
ncbi:SacI homology domain-containing protein [Rhexocercosporidium sp. MPI-PUGE-AT-0058]|nr:SacI homology domain-containing protein [Rhexocercosporidium sp. MPI-PUGE-AT-0058]